MGNFILNFFLILYLYILVKILGILAFSCSSYVCLNSSEKQIILF